MTTSHLTGVLGWPIGHSVSPPMHNAAFRALKLDWLYLPFAVQPADLTAAVSGLRALGFAGVNVTIPHKVAIRPLMDELSPEALAVGAVNTVIMCDGRMMGHNTDVQGFLTSLTAAGFTPAGCTALVLGAGGAARSIVYALAKAGAEVTICNRTAGRAAKLVSELAPFVPVAQMRAIAASAEDMAPALRETDLLVNTTPVGMTGGPPGSPLPEGLSLHSRLTVCDLIYAPPLTPLLRQARVAGAHAIGGLGMLVHQGALALTLWTGREAPVAIMERAARRALAQRERRS